MKKEKIEYTLGKDVNLDREIVLDAQGRRITEARARQIARRTLQQSAGRPSLTSAGVRSPEVKARVPMKLKKSLQREAKRRGQTSSELVRQAIEEFLRSA
ncbi:MAG: ribbon-helix-helix protein, CopG family [Actinobacteria bacterium]|nr:ribbon-helix-helix protein, CopG family [Actinomycetota bacterium]